MQTLLLFGCGAATPPPTRETVELTGSPYERGFQHGQKLGSKVRSFYTRLLASSILPNLNREQPGIAAVFPEYQKDRYQNGQFSYQLLLDSAHSLEHSIPKDYRDEMHGIADGAGVPYDQVLVTNTFVDSLLAIRSVAQLTRESGAPLLERVQVPELASDGVDNDGDGTIDNPEEADFIYQPAPVATRVELPAQSTFVFTLMDEDGVDPETVRITVGDETFTRASPELALSAVPNDATRVTATLKPASLPNGAFPLLVQAGDLKIETDPPPAHAHFMRDERLTFTAKGTALLPSQVPNRGAASSSERPPAFSFALKGQRTKDGAPLLAQQMALLDGNAAHEHTVLFVHHLASGRDIAVVGWAGLIWGFSGMNSAGLAMSCEPSDSLNNSVVNNLFAQAADLSSAKLLAAGQPIGIFSRIALENDLTADAALTRAKATPQTFGWNCLFADDSGDVRGIEVDSNFNKNGGAFELAPENDALRTASHYAKDVADMPSFTIAGQRIGPQRRFSTFYFRSLTADAQVAEALSTGTFDVDAAVKVLRTPGLVDPNDSMNAVVLEPRSRTLWTAMGQEPAPVGEFIPLTLGGAR